MFDISIELSTGKASHKCGAFFCTKIKVLEFFLCFFTYNKHIKADKVASVK